VEAASIWIERARALIAENRVEDLHKAGIVPRDDRFMPVITYPPITMYPPAEPETIFRDDPGPLRHPATAYVHIPFCASACSYCHWIKLISPTQSEIDDYLETMSMEMDLAARRLKVDRIPVTSVLFGGGTPTYLNPSRLDRVLNDFERRFDLSNCRQFSFEAEPASILSDEGLAKLQVLKDHGVDRISLGVQSFEDHILEAMGRPHKMAQALESIRQIKKVGIESISIDLIYGYPGLSLDDWIATMRTALSSGADAWQLYRLRILRHGDKQGNILDKYAEQPDDFPEVTRVYLMKALGILLSEQHGFSQHFTRIFATEQKHVTQFMWDYCCNLTDVVGVGISAWGNYDRIFTQNVGGDFDKYRQMVREGRLPVDRGILRDDETEARRSLIAPLKNDRVYKKRFEKRTGISFDAHFGPELARLEGLGLLTVGDETVTLTPRGRFFADQTMMQLHQKRYLPFADLAHDLMPE
jgi:oxygen-independent coproporphyrinogen III oxidase